MAEVVDFLAFHPAYTAVEAQQLQDISVAYGVPYCWQCHDWHRDCCTGLVAE